MIAYGVLLRISKIEIFLAGKINSNFGRNSSYQDTLCYLESNTYLKLNTSKCMIELNNLTAGKLKHK